MKDFKEEMMSASLEAICISIGCLILGGLLFLIFHMIYIK